MKLLNNTPKIRYAFLPTILFFVISLYYYFSIALSPGYNLFDIKRILELLLLALTGIYIIFNQQREMNVFGRIPDYGRVGIIIFFGLGVVSSIFAPITRMALLEVSVYILLFFYALFIAAQRYELKESIDILLISIIALSVLSYIIAFSEIYIFFKLHPQQAHQFSNTTFPGFMNLRFFSQYLIWTIPVIPLPYLLAKKLSHKIFLYLIACLWWTLTLATTTKSVWVALALSVFFYFIILRRSVLPVIWLYVKILFCAGVLYFLLFQMPQSGLLSNQYSPIDSSTNPRIYLINQAKNFILSHPFLGVGPMHFAYYINPIAAHPHNSFLQIAAEWGMPACLIILGLFAVAGFSWLKLLNALKKSNQLSPLIIMLSIGFLAGIIDSLMDGVIVTPLSQVMLFFYIGWILGIYQCYSSNQNIMTNKQLSLWLFNLIIMLALTGIGFGVFPEVLYLPTIEIKWVISQLKQHLPLTFLPRFWLQGLIK